MARSDLQRDVLHQLLELLFAGRLSLACTHFDEHADLCASVNVSRDQTISADFHAGVAGNLDVLANFADGGGAIGLKIHIGISCDLPRNLITKGAERIIASNEV